MKKQFLEKLKDLDKLNLNKNSYAITGSGPLAIRDIRAADDIDILVKPSIWQELITKYKSCDGIHIRLGIIEIWSDFLNITPILEEAIDSADIIDGYPFLSLVHTISWKKHLNRKKDQNDVILIQNYLKTHQDFKI